MPCSTRRGLVLIIIVGILGIMGVLGVCFLTLVRLERKASLQRTNRTKAFLLARSGIEDAVARLSAGQDVLFPQNRYGGENWDASADGLLNAAEAAEQLFRITAAGTAADVETCPVRHAMRPSFAASAPVAAPVPLLVRTDGRQRGYSGRLAGDRMPEGNTWSLKTEDESGKINVNGGFLDSRDLDADGVPDVRDPDVRLTTVASDTGLGWNRQLWRVLAVLGAQAEIALPTLATDIRLNRPVGGYRSIRQLQALIRTPKDLSPWLTVSSASDFTVIHPNAVVTAQVCVSDIKRQRAPLLRETGGRPPVNLNTASPPVLRALLHGLSGLVFSDLNSNNLPFAPTQVFVTPAVAGGFHTATREAIVNALLTRRQTAPFVSWPDFHAFCDGLIPTVQGIRTADAALPATMKDLLDATYVMDVVKSNFNPNTGLNKQLPDQILWRWIDKSDLTDWSTEGDFQPTGVFRVSAEGRVLGKGGRVEASCTLSADVEAFALLRQTSQKDFVAGRAPNASNTSYLSQASSLLPTSGSSASWNTWSPGTGPAAVTYPCPLPALLPPVNNAADFDGCIGLATLEYGSSAAASLRFLHRMNSLNADKGGPPVPPMASGALRIPGPNGGRLQTNLATSVWPASVEPNTFGPDGAYVQNDHSLAFPARGNLPDTTWNAGAAFNRGVFSYWCKPSQIKYWMYDFSVDRCIPMAGVGQGNTHILIAGSQPFQNPGCGMVFETAKAQETGAERHCYVKPDLDPSLRRHPQARWRLVTLLFDTNEIGFDKDGRCNVSSVAGQFTVTPNGTLPIYGERTPAIAEDLLYDTATATDSLLVLGSHGPLMISKATASNSVIDEFAVYDFTDVVDNAINDMSILAADRFKDGRYYKENDARFLSAVLSPGIGPTRILSARWTAWLPKEARRELINPYDAGGPPWTAADRLIDASLLDADLEVSLLPAAGTLVSAPVQVLSQGTRIDRIFNGFRYRVTFKPTPNWLAADRPNKPVLETPFLDDVSIAWQPLSGPRIRAWEP